MHDPIWVYGFAVTPEFLCEHAKAKAPECVYNGDDDDITVIHVIEKFGYHFRRSLLADVAIDVFDEKLEPQLVLILHQNRPDLSRFTPEDEDYIRKELEIEEKGKWYRYFGTFFLENLDEYKKTIPGPIPSRSKRKKTSLCKDADSDTEMIA